MSVTDVTGLTRRYQVQPAVPYCMTEGCKALTGLVYNDTGAHKVALAHAEVTGHEVHVAETCLVIYATGSQERAVANG